MSKALVVLSGGQDSTTCLFWAVKHYDEVHAITFNYGQKHNREIKSAEQVAFIAGVESHTIVDVPDILKSRSPLLDKSVTLETYDNYEEMDAIIGDRVELTFVPMRNAFFLTLAANYAVAMNCFTLVTGVCQQDNANYPDCREGFINAQIDTINQALGIDNFKIETPLMYLSKAESIKLAQEVDAMGALAFSHTCYAGEFPPCGECHACVLRAHGFEEAGVPDPLIERAKHENNN